MDISALSQDKFSATDWINTNFIQYTIEKGTPAENGQDTVATSLDFINTYVAKLQLYVQQINYAVEETSQQLVSNLPRIAEDAKTLQRNVLELQQRMHNVRNEVETVQKETGNCMSTLEQLNTLQTKLQIAKESLQQSDGWGNLISALEDSFERSDLESVCEKLLAMQKSLESQKKLAGHAERLAQSEDFKNRMEALASPSIVDCFVKADLAKSQHYASIFARIDRLSQLQQYYRAVHKTNLQQTWKQLLELNTLTGDGDGDRDQDQASGISTMQHNQLLTVYYEQLLEFCQRQIKWSQQVFGIDYQKLPFIILAELLPALEPTREAHILSLLKNNNDRLSLLKQYAQSDENFVSHINVLVKKMNLNLNLELKRQLSIAIYEYFHTFLQQYASLEETHLSTNIDRLIFSQISLGDDLRHLEYSNGKVFDWLHASSERCLETTKDLALCKLINLLSGILKRFLECFNKMQRQLYQNSRGQTEQWTLLQYCMSLLQLLADFQNRLQQFERQLQGKLKQLENCLNDKEHNESEINIYVTIQQKQLAHILQETTKYLEQLNDTSVIFESVHSSARSQLNEVHELVMDILLRPVETQLVQMHETVHAFTAHVMNDDLPSFSLAPNEYITQIGQYLLMLPQHLEPLLLAPSPLLKQALEQCHARYIPSSPCADVLLGLVVEKCCSLYCVQLMQIKSVSAAAAKQLVVDIEYLSNVTEELGGLTLTTNLSQILQLLKAPPEQYFNLSAGCDPRLVTTIRQMRNIMSTQ